MRLKKNRILKAAVLTKVFIVLTIRKYLTRFLIAFICQEKGVYRKRQKRLNTPMISNRPGAGIQPWNLRSAHCRIMVLTNAGIMAFMVSKDMRRLLWPQETFRFSAILYSKKNWREKNGWKSCCWRLNFPTEPLFECPIYIKACWKVDGQVCLKFGFFGFLAKKMTAPEKNFWNRAGRPSNFASPNSKMGVFVQALNNLQILFPYIFLHNRKMLTKINRYRAMHIVLFWIDCNGILFFCHS